MPATFSRTLRSLETDRPGRWATRTLQLLLAALLAGWGAWFLFGQVPVYEVTTRARLEVTRAAHPVAAQVAGQIAQTNLMIGREVRERDVLAVLDAETEQLALGEKVARRDALPALLTALGREIEAERKAMAVQLAARDLAVEEARAQQAEAEAKAVYAKQHAEIMLRLRTRHAAAELEFNESQAQANASRATARARALAVRRLEKDRSVQESERQTRLAKLDREEAELRSELATVTAAIHRLQHDIEMRTIRAPITGRLGEVVEFHTGSVVRAGEKLGAIIPTGAPHVVAWFPAAVVGRIHPDQPARLRLEGFPWTQYGTLPATVTDVGNEPSGGLVRVELVLPTDLATPIPLQHGLPGSAEVEVERVSPATLLLRAAGQFLHVKRSPGGTEGDRATRTEP
jgi:membrane fusion protein (multidrug efflux system)